MVILDSKNLIILRHDRFCAIKFVRYVTIFKELLFHYLFIFRISIYLYVSHVSYANDVQNKLVSLISYINSQEILFNKFFQFSANFG
jgi:hypothetical protein